MTKVVVTGNYLDASGVPVLATQMPSPRENHIGGIGTALGWTVRWIKAASDVVEVFSNSGDELAWDHGRSRHVAKRGDWIVWTGHAYRVVTDSEFRSAYSAVPFALTSPTGQTPAHPGGDQ